MLGRKTCLGGSFLFLWFKTLISPIYSKVVVQFEIIVKDQVGYVCARFENHSMPKAH